MTERLLEGVSVAGLPDWDQGRSQRIRFIDFDHAEHNDFLAVNQFRVDEPGGQAKRFVVPDVVLFVNGIPIVVIERKSPYIGSSNLAGQCPVSGFLGAPGVWGP
jgi:type I restriction enzyme R subunit